MSIQGVTRKTAKLDGNQDNFDRGDLDEIVTYLLWTYGFWRIDDVTKGIFQQIKCQLNSWKDMDCETFFF